MDWNDLTQDQKDAVYLLYGEFLAAGLLLAYVLMWMGLIPPQEG